MRRTLLAFALAVGGLVAAAGPADAQVYAPTQSYWFNPWTPYANFGTTTYNPYVGLGTRSYAFDPWTGARMSRGTFVNPVTGFGRSYSYGYNPWFNTYQYQYNYRLPRTYGGWWR
jgi:hypothetical protein